MNRSNKNFALSLSLALCTGFQLNAMPMPHSNTPDNSAPASVSQRMKAALTKAQTGNDFKYLRIVMEEPGFSAEETTSAADKKRIADLVSDALSTIKSNAPTDESIRCQALIARYFAETDQTDKAIVNYSEAIKASQKSWRRLHEQTLAASILEPGCYKALTLLYLKKGKLAEAEQQYRKANWPWENLSGAEKEKMFRTNMARSANRTGQAYLASRLGEAYAAKGLNKQALEKFADMLAFETFALDSGSRDPFSSNTPIVKWSMKLSPDSLSQHENFDPLVGSYPPLEAIVEPYIKFSKKHPELVKREALERVEKQLHLLSALRQADAARDKNFDWRLKEQQLFGILRIEPAKGLAELKEEIAERKKIDPKDPVLANSMNHIGYQLLQVGLYTEAEKFLHEAIDLREKQGPPGRCALGNSLSNLGLLYLEEGKLTQSKSLLERALKLRDGDPSDEFAVAKTQIVYGRLLAAQGNRDEAETVLKAAAQKLQRNNPTIETIKGTDLVNANLNDFKALSERHATKFMEQSIGNLYYHQALIELAALYLEEKKYDAARQTIAQVVAIPPEGDDLALNARKNEKLGRIDTATGRLDDAAKELAIAETAIKEHKACGMTAVDILSALGDLNRQQNRTDQAHEYYRRAADQLEKMLGAQNTRVVNLRKLAAS